MQSMAGMGMGDRMKAMKEMQADAMNPNSRAMSQGKIRSKRGAKSKEALREKKKKERKRKKKGR